MENEPFTILAAQSLFGIYGVIYIGGAIFAPNWFLNNLAINHIERRRQSIAISSDKPWWLWPLTIATFLAVGVLLYAAIYAVVAVVPHDWGGFNEDGEWESLRYLMQMCIGGWGSLFLVERLEHNAEILVWGPHERKARRVALKAVKIIQDATAIGPELRERLATDAEKELDSASNGYEMDYAKDVSRLVGDSIRG